MFTIGQLVVLNNMYKHMKNYVESHVYICIRKKYPTLATSDKKCGQKVSLFQLGW